MPKKNRGRTPIFFQLPVKCSPPERALARGGGGGFGFARTARQASSSLCLLDAAPGRIFQVRDLVRTTRGVEAPPEGGLGTSQGFDGASQRKFHAFRTLEVERVALADLLGQRSGGLSPEGGLKIAVSHGCNGGARAMEEQTIVFHPRDKKNS